MLCWSRYASSMGWGCGEHYLLTSGTFFTPSVTMVMMPQDHVRTDLPIPLRSLWYPETPSCRFNGAKSDFHHTVCLAVHYCLVRFNHPFQRADLTLLYTFDIDHYAETTHAIRSTHTIGIYTL